MGFRRGGVLVHVYGHQKTKNEQRTTENGKRKSNIGNRTTAIQKENPLPPISLSVYRAY